MPFDKSGTMIVRTYTAAGALPVAGTVIRIFGVDEENRFVEYSIVTDIDGVTESITLPAPSRVFSQSPGAAEPSFAHYNLEITAPGYYTKRINNVSVFDGEETIQLVNMIPIEINDNNATYPRNNLNVFIQENQDLE